MSVFANIVDAGKRHPMILLGGTAAVILIVLLRSGGKSSAGATGVYAMVSDPNAVAANTQLVLAQDALTANGATLAAQVAMNADNNAAALENATIQGNIASQYIGAMQDVTNEQTAGAVDVTNNQTAGAVAIQSQTIAAAETTTNYKNSNKCSSSSSSLHGIIQQFTYFLLDYNKPQRQIDS